MLNRVPLPVSFAKAYSMAELTTKTEQVSRFPCKRVGSPHFSKLGRRSTDFGSETASSLGFDAGSSAEAVGTACIWMRAVMPKITTATHKTIEIDLLMEGSPDEKTVSDIILWGR
jgi:hypothetical protein